MTVRNAAINDIEKLAILFDAYRVFYEKDSDLQEAKKFLLQRITNNESRIIIAIDKEDMVGFVQLYPIFSSTRMKKLWLLNDLFVDENHRGKGISKQLIKQCKDLCNDTGACGLILETAKTHTTGNNLYVKTDFILDENHNYYSWDVI